MSDSGHGPVDKKYVAFMNSLAKDLDMIFNGGLKGEDRTVCFTLLLTTFGDTPGERVNYISNGNRPEIVRMMKELIERFEAQAISEAQHGGGDANNEG